MTDLHERWVYLRTHEEARVFDRGVWGWCWDYKGCGWGGFATRELARAHAERTLVAPTAKLACAVGELPPPGTRFRVVSPRGRLHEILIQTGPTSGPTRWVDYTWDVLGGNDPVESMAPLDEVLRWYRASLRKPLK